MCELLFFFNVRLLCWLWIMQYDFFSLHIKATLLHYFILPGSGNTWNREYENTTLLNKIWKYNFSSVLWRENMKIISFLKEKTWKYIFVITHKIQNMIMILDNTQSYLQLFYYTLLYKLLVTGLLGPSNQYRPFSPQHSAHTNSLDPITRREKKQNVIKVPAATLELMKPGHSNSQLEKYN